MIKKILMLTSDYLPLADANGLCVSKVAEELSKQGNNVEIIGYSKSTDDSIVSINGVKLHTVFTPKYKSFIRNHTNKSDINKNNYSDFIKSYLLKIYILMHIPFYPLSSFVFLSRYFRKVKELNKKNKYDVIICAYNPIESLLTGALIKRRNPHIKFVLYMLDTLSNKPSSSKPFRFIPENFINRRGRKFENWLYKRADRIINIETYKPYFLENMSFYDKFLVKMHFCGIPLIVKPKTGYKIKNLDVNRNINLLYAGHFYKGMREPDYLCELIDSIQNTRVSVDFYSKGCVETLQYYSDKNSNKINLKGFIEHKKLILETEKADFLLNVGNKETPMVPSKLFEYMSTGKPIIHFYYDDNDSSLQYLNKYPLSLLIKIDSANKINDTLLLEKFLSDSLNKRLSFNEIELLFPKNIPSYTVGKIKDLLWYALVLAM